MLNIQPLHTQVGTLPTPNPAKGRTAQGKAQPQKQATVNSLASSNKYGAKVGAKTGAMSKVRSSETDWAESEWNPAYFEAIVEQFQSRIYRFIYGMVGESELAHDLTQDTFLSAYKNLCKRAEERQASEDNFAEENINISANNNNMSAWLYTIARNAALSEMRRRKVVRFFSFWQRSEAGSEDEIDGSADTAVIEAGGNLEARTALRDELDRAMNHVGRERLTALLLHMDGFSYKEICDITGDSLSSVKSQIFRAKESLRRTLATQNQHYQSYLAGGSNSSADSAGSNEGGQD
jgi:RNA polymerase sigma-70 factor (ECF subfamily)